MKGNLKRTDSSGEGDEENSEPSHFVEFVGYLVCSLLQFLEVSTEDFPQDLCRVEKRESGKHVSELFRVFAWNFHHYSVKPLLINTDVQ